MRIVGIIPSRYASTRFPGKPLVDISGKTMIRRVYEQAAGSKLLDHLVVATDDQRILDEVLSFGGQAMMTAESHLNGTERCAETVGQLDEPFDFVINIQGDEPFISPRQIDLLAGSLGEKTQLATVVKHEMNEALFLSPHIIKVFFNQNREALYFSRNPMPAAKEPSKFTGFYKHIGLYAYRTDILQAITRLEPSPLEVSESLEQLRWLENGYAIQLVESNLESHSVDTPQDLERILQSEGLIP